jgi:hypothetical protein
MLSSGPRCNLIPMIQSLSEPAAIERLKGLYQRFFGLNLGVVEPGRVYRSARPGHDLSRLMKTYRLASILDLQSDFGVRPWCIAGFHLSGGSKIDYFRFPIPFGLRPLREELFALITVFENCRYPLLIHCLTGADRTGLASGIYLMAILGRPPERAFGQAFSPRFGHFPVFGAEHLHEPFREYAGWLREHRLAHTPVRLKFWLGRVYRSGTSPAGDFSDPTGTGDAPEVNPDLAETAESQPQTRGQIHRGSRVIGTRVGQMSEAPVNHRGPQFVPVAGASDRSMDGGEPAQAAKEPKRVEQPPRAVGRNPMTAGIAAGMASPQPGPSDMITPLSGTLVPWFRGLRAVEDWAREKYPGMHRRGMDLLNRFSEDLERRYPCSVRGNIENAGLLSELLE